MYVIIPNMSATLINGLNIVNIVNNMSRNICFICNHDNKKGNYVNNHKSTIFINGHMSYCPIFLWYFNYISAVARIWSVAQNSSKSLFDILFYFQEDFLRPFVKIVPPIEFNYNLHYTFLRLSSPSTIDSSARGDDLD